MNDLAASKHSSLFVGVVINKEKSVAAMNVERFRPSDKKRKKNSRPRSAKKASNSEICVLLQFGSSKNPFREQAAATFDSFFYTKERQCAKVWLRQVLPSSILSYSYFCSISLQGPSSQRLIFFVVY